MIRFALPLLLAAPLAGQDRVTPLQHAAIKTAASTTVYAVAREGLGMPRWSAALVSTVGVLGVAKLAERAKGHRLPFGDLVHDAGWHSLFVIPLSINPRRHPRLASLAFVFLAGGLVATRHLARPRW